MDQDVKQLVSRVRQEGVNKIIKLRSKISSTKDNEDLTSNLSEVNLILVT